MLKTLVDPSKSLFGPWFAQKHSPNPTFASKPRGPPTTRALVNLLTPARLPTCPPARLPACPPVHSTARSPACPPATKADWLAGRQAEKPTGGQADRQTGRQADRQTGRQADRQTSRQAVRQTGRQADCRQADKDIRMYMIGCMDSWIYMDLLICMHLASLLGNFQIIQVEVV